MKRSLVGLSFPLLLLAPPNQQSRTLLLTGRVTDSTSARELQGAQIRIVELNVSVGTDERGRYRIHLPGQHRGQDIPVQVRSIGFKPQAKTVRLAGDSTTLDFALTVDVNRLSEVAITGVTGATETKKLAFTVDKVPEGASPPASNPSPTGSPSPAATPPPPGNPGPQPATIQLRGANSIAVGSPAPNAATTLPTAAVHGWTSSVDNAESYERIRDNPFLRPRDNPLSTFSVDVDRASYSNVRRFISMGQRPPKDAVRIEEMVNYFAYDYPEPDRRHPFSVTTEVARAPWNDRNLLVRVGLQARRLSPSSLPPNNLVFLIDVSGSMSGEDRLPLVKESLRLLVKQLREQDRVAIVVYAGAAGLVLPPTSGDQKHVILGALDRLHAGGSTAGGAGIRLAYEVARQYHQRDGNNRVILATDGDFNVGASSDAEMERLIEEKRQQGTFLSVLGFGRGNLKDSKMEKLADKGNGNYAYIDNIVEAQKVLVDEMAGTLLTLAKDVKLQVEFNPRRVGSYRLIGYENRMLRKEDFNDDTKDAGEIGAGHSVTALYEIVPLHDEQRRGDVDPLRYQSSPRDSFKSPDRELMELMYVKLRYKQPNANDSRLLEHAVMMPSRYRASADFRFAAAVAAFGMVLRESEYRGHATLESVLELARESLGHDEAGHRAGFVRLVEQVREQSLLAWRER
jgi:Ca-activated chloride channel family protein